MLVMGSGGVQYQVAWMRLRVLPIAFFFASPDFVAIGIDDCRQFAIDYPLANTESNAMIELDFA